MTYLRHWHISVMPRPLHTVVENPEFHRRVRRILTDAEQNELIGYLAANPDAGDPMPGTGGARKLRWEALGKDKRGGARVITFYSGAPVPVFLLTIFGKGEKVNLTKAERNELRKVLGELVAEYRRGVGRHVQGR